MNQVAVFQKITYYQFSALNHYFIDMYLMMKVWIFSSAFILMISQKYIRPNNKSSLIINHFPRHFCLYAYLWWLNKHYFWYRRNQITVFFWVKISRTRGISQSFVFLVYFCKFSKSNLWFHKNSMHCMNDIRVLCIWIN